MTPEKLARIRAHLDNEAVGSHPQEVMDAVLWGLIEDAESPPGASGYCSSSHGPGGDVSSPGTARRCRDCPTTANTGSSPGLIDDEVPSPRTLGVSGKDARAPGGDEGPVCLFGPGGDFQTPWPPRSE